MLFALSCFQILLVCNWKLFSLQFKNKKVLCITTDVEDEQIELNGKEITLIYIYSFFEFVILYDLCDVIRVKYVKIHRTFISGPIRQLTFDGNNVNINITPKRSKINLTANVVYYFGPSLNIKHSSEMEQDLSSNSYMLRICHIFCLS